MSFNLSTYFTTVRSDGTKTGVKYTGEVVEAISDSSLYTLNADGSFTLTGLNTAGDIQDRNTGFPGPITPTDPTGTMPGSGSTLQPSTDSAGEELELGAPTATLVTGVGAGATMTTVTLIYQRDLDSAGNPSAFAASYAVVGYNSTGFLIQEITGFYTIDMANNVYGGTLEPIYEVFTPGTSLNTYDADGNPTGVTLKSAFGGSNGYNAANNTVTFYPLSKDVAPPPTSGTPFACFAAGTRLSAPGGEVLVDDVAEGDLLLTLSGAARPVIWHGRRTVDCRRHPDPRSVWPVRIEPGAFGIEAGKPVPSRPLLISPDHAVWFDGAMIAVKALINGTTVRQLLLDEVTYHHVELASHDVIFAEGLAVESFLDTGNKVSFEESAAVLLHADFALRQWEAKGYAPLTVAGPQVDALRARLAEVARGFGLEAQAAA